MRDGIVLSVDIYRPRNEPGPWPAILAYSPFQKERFFESPKPQFYCANGYVCVQASERGIGLNQGMFEMHGVKAAEDGHDLVEWLADQPWCTGNVAMMGASGYSVMAWSTAALNPPHLKSLVVLGTTDNYRGLCYPGGVLRRGFVLNLVFGFTHAAVWPGPIPGKEKPMNIVAEILANYEDGPFWSEHGGTWNRIDRIQAPVLNLMNTPNRLHATYHLRSYPDIKSPKKLVITPWTNENYQPWIFETTAMNEYILKWLDYWMKGVDTGIMNEPEIAIYDNGTGSWSHENEYPLHRTSWTKLFLGGCASDEIEHGNVQPSSPAGDEKPDTFDNVNLNFALLASYGISALPSEQKHYMVYLSEPLTEDLKIWGPVSFCLYASTNEEVTSNLSFFVKMGEMVADGVPLNPVTGEPESKPEVTDTWTPKNVQIWSWGALKAKYREIDESRSRKGLPWHPFRNPKELVPNQVYEFQIEMQPVFKTFRAGSRIWIKIACEDATHATMDCGSRYIETPSGVRNRQVSIFHDSNHPSHILLPVIPDNPEPVPVKAPLLDALPGAPKFVPEYPIK